jgi:hypothetical protein
MGDKVMRLLFALLIVTLLAPAALAVIPQDIINANNDMLMWMDKYTWTTYTNPYTGVVVTVTTAERATAKANAVTAYNLWKTLSLAYAQQLGIIN